MAHNHKSETDVLSLDLKDLWFYVVFYRTLLGLCVLGAISFTAMYVAFFRVDTFKAEVALKMAASAPSSALSTLLASLNASESPTAKLEALSELFGSSEFGEALLQSALQDKSFFVQFTVSEGLHPKYRNQKTSTSQSAGAPSDPPVRVEDLDERFKEQLVHRLTHNLQFRPDQTAATLTVSARASKPWIATALAELAGRAIVDLNYKRKLVQVTSLKNFLAKQLQDTSEKLSNYEAALATHQRLNGLLNESGSGNPTIVRYTKVQEEIEELKRLVSANADRIKINEKELDDFRGHLNDPMFFKANIYLNQLQYRMRTLAYELDLAKSSDASGISTSTPNDIEGLKGELTQLNKTYNDALNKSAEGKNLPVASPIEYFQELEKGLNTLQKERSLLNTRYRRAIEELKQVKVDADLLPNQMRDFAGLKRNISLASTIYLETEKKLQEVRFMEAETVNDLSLLYRAKMPEEPDNFSLSRLFVIMIVLGLVFGGLLILNIEVFGQTIRSKSDLERACDQVLGTVPKIESEAPMTKLSDVKPTLKFLRDSLIPTVAYPTSLVLEVSPDSQDADNFRSLRMHLFKLLQEDDSFQGHKCQVIMITSPGPNAGRTFMAANLALTLAKADLKTLLIDLDLRKPDLYEFFPNCPPADAQKVFADGGLKTGIQKHAPHLDVLLLRGQTSHPPEILESHELEEFFKWARSEYDFVLFDSPAVLKALDPSISSALADLVIMTAESLKTTRDEFAGAIRKIRSCNNKPIYGVLNFSDRRRDAAA